MIASACDDAAESGVPVLHRSLVTDGSDMGFAGYFLRDMGQRQVEMMLYKRTLSCSGITYVLAKCSNSACFGKYILPSVSAVSLPSSRLKNKLALKFPSSVILSLTVCLVFRNE